MKFSESNVRRLKAPEGKSDITIWDNGMPGFGIRFRDGGAGVYIIQYKVDGKDAKLTLGKVAKLTLEAAQTEAKKHFASIAQRIDPRADRIKAEAETKTVFENQISPFIAFMRRRDRSESYISWTENCLRTYAPSLIKRPMGAIKRGEIAIELNNIIEARGPIAARNTRAALSKFFSWAIGEGIAEHNPVDGTNKEQSKPRERVLTPDELVTIWRGLGEGDFADILRILILTGARKTQIGDLRRSEIKGDVLDLPAVRNKNRTRFLIPISKQVQAILDRREARGDSEYVFGEGEGGFSGWSKCKERLDRRLGDSVAPWTVHDFRRTFMSLGQDVCKIAPHIADACLHHKGEAKAGIKGVYNHATYLDEKRAALDCWGNYIDNLLNPAAPDNVVHIRRA